jgi:hypothetical protein
VQHRGALPGLLPQWRHRLVILDPVSRGTGSNRIRDKARCQMPVMPLDHPRIGVSKVLRHDHQRHAVHHCVRSPRVAEDMEADRGLNLAVVASLSRRPRTAAITALALPEAAVNDAGVTFR